MSPWGRTCAERRASGDPSAVANESLGTDARRTFGRLRMRTSPVTRANFPTTTNERSVISISLKSTVLLTANAHDLAGGGTRSATCPSGPTSVSYTHLRAPETRHDLVCRLLLEK